MGCVPEIVVFDRQEQLCVIKSQRVSEIKNEVLIDERSVVTQSLIKILKDKHRRTVNKFYQGVSRLEN